ncbi:right-handed parallel beta-helix repeat-containing protein [Sphingomonas sp.]|uniref:right-handed parallel beta-helix repeat-containing protein n=1 Tax=Sphingomonas sp. TaxID=28214 RepID=UPI003D6CA688
MKGDISADFHAPAKRFSGVRAQAGRVLTDADFNAAFDVLDDTLETLVRTLLCAAGSPDSGLKILAASPASVALPNGSNADTYEVDLSPGTFVLGGRASVLRMPIASLDQIDWLSQPLTPDVLPPKPVNGRTDLVWVEQVEAPVFMVEDRELHERALGSADTTTRLRPQIRIRVLDDVPPECGPAAETLVQTLALGGHQMSDDHTETLSAARLGIAFVSGGPNLDPCAPAGAAGYLGAENQTLRIMLTAPNRFVWAYDHGTPLYRVNIDAASGEVEFLTEPPDPVLFPLPGQVIEILPWDVLLPNREKAAAPLGHLARLTGHYDPASRRIAYDGSMPAAWQTWLNAMPPIALGREDDPPRFFFARVWQPPVSGAGPDQATGINIVLPESGIALHFAGQGLPGDYWTVALRPNAPELIQPWNLMIEPAIGEVPVAPPIGPRRFHAPLGLLTWSVSGAGVATAEIHDCRNRFRRLCKIRGCCTYHVGDGQSSFGDYQNIQEAIDALPPEGGELCLLPGTHHGRIDLRGRHDIKISGCSRRTRIEIDADPAHPHRPCVWLDGAKAIRFSDFNITGAGGPVFGAHDLCEDISFERLHILARDSAAIALAHADRICVAHCVIRADKLAEALTEDMLLALLPLIYLAGEELSIQHNDIIADHVAQNRNRIALGGIQIGGDSRNVRIEDNRIEGGNGHGITLGSIIPGGKQPGGDVVIWFPPWVVVDKDGCIKIKPGGTTTIPGPDGEKPPQSAGPVRTLRIRGNAITEHGGSGISIAHWFMADPNAKIEELDDIEVEDAKIDDNRIHRCSLIDLVSALPVDAAFSSGFGGIALAATADLVIDDNDIRECGGDGRSPICGIYIRFAERLRITRNRISDNGRPASLTDPLLVGNIGGIVISHADGVEEAAGSAVREIPAAFIAENHVVSPEGRALELLGTGTMMVQENSLTSHGNNIVGLILQLLARLLVPKDDVGGKLAADEELKGQLRAVLAQIGGSAVLILNTGRNPNLAAFGYATTPLTGEPVTHNKPPPPAPVAQPAAAPAATGVSTQPVDGPVQLEPVVVVGSKRRNESVLGAMGVNNQGAAPLPPGGQVSFSDNMVAFDARSTAITISLCSVAILSFDDVGMHDNVCSVDLIDDFVLINALVFGFASCRTIGNRFRETIKENGVGGTGIAPTFLSALTFGILNATELNQGDYCFLVLGKKKPRVLIDTTAAGTVAYLDTNRHTIDEDYCAKFQRINFDYGTDLKERLHG